MDRFEPAMLGGFNLIGLSFGNLEEETANNMAYRRVVATTKEAQLVLMSLRPGISIGEEVHPTTTQFMRVEKGMAKVLSGDQHIHLEEDGTYDWAIIPSGVNHDVTNTSQNSRCHLYVIYMPPVHIPGLVQMEKPVED